MTEYKENSINANDNFIDNHADNAVIETANSDVMPIKRKNDPLNIILISLIVVVLVTVIAVISILISVFCFGTTKELDTKAIDKSLKTTTVDTVAPKQTQTKETKAEEETVAPTQQNTKPPKKESKQNKPVFSSYLITLYPTTYIYAGPGYDYDCTMTLDEQGVYTIVDESYNTSTKSKWGKLKSGVGWINLSNPKENPNQSETSTFKPYVMTVDAQTDVYAGPGYNYDITMTISEKGAYTIVEEYTVVEYSDIRTEYVWGKLKSGAGWIFIGAQA